MAARSQPRFVRLRETWLPVVQQCRPINRGGAKRRCRAASGIKSSLTCATRRGGRARIDFRARAREVFSLSLGSGFQGHVKADPAPRMCSRWARSRGDTGRYAGKSYPITIIISKVSETAIYFLQVGQPCSSARGTLRARTGNGSLAIFCI